MYDRWLLDAPKLLDASALFGFSNPALARRLLASAVRLEPRYADDLAEAIGAAAEALNLFREHLARAQIIDDALARVTL